MSRFVLPRQFPFDDALLPYRIAPMRLSDLDQVMEIEREAFPAPWPASAYRYELVQNGLSTYLTLRLRHVPPTRGWPRAAGLWPRGRPSLSVLAYGGFWIIVDEAHISTLAVHPDWRGRGLGEVMLVSLIDAAILLDAAELTLEVRVSNQAAQNLYRKYAFAIVGRRKRYYRDNDEDALIMTTPRLDEAAFQGDYAARKMALRERLCQSSLVTGPI